MMVADAFTLIGGGALVTFALIAGSAFLFTSYASQDVPPVSLTALRLTIGSSGLLLISAVTGKICWLKAASYHELVSLAIIGFANTAIPYTLLAAALSQGVNVATAAVLSGAAPLFATVLSALFLTHASKVWFQPKRLLGLSLGFAGVIIIAFIKQIVKDKNTTSTVTGVILQLFGVLSKAVAAVLAEHHNSKFQTGMPVFVQAFLQAAAGALIAIPVALAMDCTHMTPKILDPHRVAQSGAYCGFVHNANQQAIFGVLYLGVCSSCIVYILQFFLLKTVGAVRQMLVDYLTPAVGIVEGALFKDEWKHIHAEEQMLFSVGVVLIVTGLVLVQLSRPVSSSTDVSKPLTSLEPVARGLTFE